MVNDQPGLEACAGDWRYRHLFEHMPICIFVTDVTVVPALVVEANQHATRVFGYACAEMVGMPAAHLVVDGAWPAVLANLSRVEQGEMVTAETVCQHRDGSKFPARVILARDPAKDGHIIAIVEDCTAESQRRSEAEAIDVERHRIAHEIHDGVAQTLAGLRFKSALWSQLTEAAPPRMRAALDELQTVLNAAIVDLRRAIFALRPVDLDAVGFLPALRQLVSDFGDQNQLVAELEVSGPQEALPARYELPLFRVIQESLNNTGQHARASLVSVFLRIETGGGIAVSVRDNGCGFDPTQIGASGHSEHFGLRQMRERIVELGGTLDIHGENGQGTELLITLPTPRREVNYARQRGAQVAVD